MHELFHVRNDGILCEAGGFSIDSPSSNEFGAPGTVILTHAHADHLRIGTSRSIERILCTHETAAFLRHRVDHDLPIVELAYGENLQLGQTQVSLHPAGHILGAAQIRVQSSDGRVEVYTGDYSCRPNPTCQDFESLRCERMISEATFAFPIYVWPREEESERAMVELWQSESQSTTLLFAYSLGKAQHLLSLLHGKVDRPIFVHGAVEAINRIYRECGVNLPPAKNATEASKEELKGALVLAPPSAFRSPWMKRFKTPATAFVSGWMKVRGPRIRVGYEYGFVLSDHADWNDHHRVAAESKATDIVYVHENADLLAQSVSKRLGVQATVQAIEHSLQTREQASPKEQASDAKL